MYDDGTNGDLIANDGIYSIQIPFQNFNGIIKYYFRARNNDALVLLPERAEYEFFEYSNITSIVDMSTSHKELIKIVDVLGREVSEILYNKKLFFVFSDGSVEKKLFVR